MAAKKQQEFHKEPLILILLAVVFSAAAVILLKVGGANSLNPLATGVYKQVLVAETPSELMQALEQTDSDLSTSEFDQLQMETKGL